jgi:metal transporter CNNM
MNPLPIVPEDLPLLQILNTFQEGRSHIAIVCRRKPGFSFISPKGSKAFGSGSSGKEDQIDSDMEKGESTAEQSLLRSLFYSKKDKEQTGDGGLLATALANDARISRTSLREQYLDEDYPVGVITLEDVLEGMLPSLPSNYVGTDEGVG